MLSDEQNKAIQEMLDLLPKHTKCYSVTTIARCWNISTRTLYNYMEEGKLLYVQIGKKNRRITYESLMSFLSIYQI